MQAQRTKKCSKCGEEKALGEFYADKRASDGLRSSCKPCHCATTKRSYETHREKRLARHRKHYQANRKRRIEQAAEWVKRNPEKRRAIKARHDKKHREAIRAYNKRYYAENAERERQRTAEYRAENPDKVLGWRDPEKSAIYRERRRALLLDAYVEDVHLDVLILRDEGRCGICGDPIMGVIEKDHIVPLSRGGEHSYANVQLSHRDCNRRKHARVLT